MNKKEIQEKLNNLPKPKYLYQRYEGMLTKYIIDEKCYIECKTGFTTPKDSILLGEASENIIDLIEVGDYVNGQKITKITGDLFIKNQIDLWTDRTILFQGDYQRERFIEDEIETIVTKEQFNQVKYEV